LAIAGVTVGFGVGECMAFGDAEGLAPAAEAVGEGCDEADADGDAATVDVLLEHAAPKARTGTARSSATLWNRIFNSCSKSSFTTR
jgi:hypothetical protein